MSTPTPRTDEARRIDNGDTHPLLDEMETLERELAAERETSRLLKVAMDARDEGYTQSRRRMSALESEVTAKGQAVRNLAEVISGQDKELERERAKVRTLREACETIVFLEVTWPRWEDRSYVESANDTARAALAATQEKQ